jgi:zinc and cadmium transporter
MNILLWILLVTFIDGLVALTGAFTFVFKKKQTGKILFVLVAFSAGALLSGAFFHLLAESLDKIDAMTVFSYTISGFILFFLFERFLHWHHCAEEECRVKPFSYMILYGDAVHNLIDGLIIAVSFMTSIPFGIVTSLVIIAHEVPQEIANFGVLLYGGFKRRKALLYNFLSQLTAVLGGILGYFFFTGKLVDILIPFAAGGLIYIAASDLIPEINDEKSLKKSIIAIASFIFGVLLLLLMKILFG